MRKGLRTEDAKNTFAKASAFEKELTQSDTEKPSDAIGLPKASQSSTEKGMRHEED
jgi:hypothetical protein